MNRLDAEAVGNILLRVSLGRLSAYGALQECQALLPARPGAHRSPVLRYRAGELVEVRQARRVDTVAWWRRMDDDARYLEEQHWVPALEQVFTAWGAQFAGRLMGSSRRWSRRREQRAQVAPGLTPSEIMHHIFQRDQVFNDFTNATESLYQMTFNVAVSGVWKQFGIAFDLGPEDAVYERVKDRANQLAGNVADTVYKDVKSALTWGIHEGESIPDLANRVRDKMTGTSKMRATRIARTEVISAYNGAVRDGGDAFDGVVGYEWIATVDGRVRPEHLAANHQKIAKDEMFRVGGYSMKHPGDPSAPARMTVNCRCAMAPLVDLEELPPISGPGLPKTAPVPAPAPASAPVPGEKPAKLPRKSRKTGEWPTETPEYSWHAYPGNKKGEFCKYSTHLADNKRLTLTVQKGPLAKREMDEIAHGMELARAAGKPTVKIPKIHVVETGDAGTLGYTYLNRPDTIYMQRDTLTNSVRRATMLGQVPRSAFHPGGIDLYSPWTSTVMHEYGHIQDFTFQKLKAASHLYNRAPTWASYVSEYANYDGLETIAESFAWWTQTGGQLNIGKAGAQLIEKVTAQEQVRALAKQRGWRVAVAGASP